MSTERPRETPGSVRAFYDELAPLYHLVYEDWESSVARQGAALASLIAEHWGADTRSILQLHVRGDEKVPGHGVGLAVVNDLVASHDGELVLTRSELGGARVDITLRAG